MGQEKPEFGLARQPGLQGHAQKALPCMLKPDLPAKQSATFSKGTANKPPCRVEQSAAQNSRLLHDGGPNRTSASSFKAVRASGFDFRLYFCQLHCETLQNHMHLPHGGSNLCSALWLVRQQSGHATCKQRQTSCRTTDARFEMRDMKPAEAAPEVLLPAELLRRSSCWDEPLPPPASPPANKTIIALHRPSHGCDKFHNGPRSWLHSKPCTAEGLLPCTAEGLLPAKSTKVRAPACRNHRR